MRDLGLSSAAGSAAACGLGDLIGSRYRVGGGGEVGEAFWAFVGAFRLRDFFRLALVAVAAPFLATLLGGAFVAGVVRFLELLPDCRSSTTTPTSSSLRFSARMESVGFVGRDNSSHFVINISRVIGI